MTSLTAQQTTLDLELVLKENRLTSGKSMEEFASRIKLKRNISSVLDALALTPCYPAFLITADVPEKRSISDLWSSSTEFDNSRMKESKSYKTIILLCYKMKEARMKSLRNFHKTHPSGSGTVAEKPPSVEKITPTVTSEGTCDKPGVLDVTNDDSSESEFESWGNDEDDSNNEQESSDESSMQENESEEQELDSEQVEESDDDDQE
ncbi:hypothetical protein Tco_1473904 [Tanacetum coccineum]